MKPILITRLSERKAQQVAYDFIGDNHLYGRRLISVKVYQYVPTDENVKYIDETRIQYCDTRYALAIKEIVYHNGLRKKYEYRYSSMAWAIHSRIYSKWLRLKQYTEYKGNKKHGICYREDPENCTKVIEDFYVHGRKTCSLQYNSRHATNLLKYKAETDLNLGFRIRDKTNDIELLKYEKNFIIKKTYKGSTPAENEFLLSGHAYIDTNVPVFLSSIIKKKDFFTIVPYSELEQISGNNVIRKLYEQYWKNRDTDYITTVSYRSQDYRVWTTVQYYRDTDNTEPFAYRRNISHRITDKYTIHLKYSDRIILDKEFTQTNDFLPNVSVNSTCPIITDITVMSGRLDIMKYSRYDAPRNRNLGAKELYPDAPDLVTALGKDFDPLTFDESMVDFLKLQYA